MVVNDYFDQKTWISGKYLNLHFSDNYNKFPF